MTEEIKIPNQPNLKSISTWIATWFGIGFLRPAPGTWGSFAALPFGVIIYGIAGWPLLIISAATLYPIAVRTAHQFGQETGNHDDKRIVIDEVIGQWIAMIPALAIMGMNPLYVFLSFAFFRFFDILKPWPVCFFDQKIQNAHGVILDDIAAGLYAALLTYGTIMGVMTFNG